MVELCDLGIVNCSRLSGWWRSMIGFPFALPHTASVSRNFPLTSFESIDLAYGKTEES